jgi:hypothetical protein
VPEEILLELETAPPVAGSLENIEDLVRVVTRELASAVEGMRGSALKWENAWRHIIIRDVAKGQTAHIQELRPRLVIAFEELFTQLKETHKLAIWLHKSGRADVPNPEMLLPEITGMERLKATVFDRWQTADDLEDLAARDYPLTTADLDQIGPQRRPPASYYAEQNKPF